jgi:hypothetical protein
MKRCGSDYFYSLYVIHSCIIYIIRKYILVLSTEKINRLKIIYLRNTLFVYIIQYLLFYYFRIFYISCNIKMIFITY